MNEELMTVRKRHRRVPVVQDLKLHVFEVVPATNPPHPAVVIVHGTAGGGSGGRRWRLRLATALATQGITAVVFDHRGCGYSDGAFEDCTVSARLDDYHAVLSSLEDVDTQRIGAFGFSLGSAVIVLREAGLPRVAAATFYTLPCEMAKNYDPWFRERFDSEDAFKAWVRDGGRVFVDEPKEFFTAAFREDLRNHDVLSSIVDLQIPLLLLQSEKDLEVYPEISFKAFNMARHPDNRSIVLRGKHSFEDDEEKEAAVIGHTIDWFKSHLFC